MPSWYHIQVSSRIEEIKGKFDCRSGWVPQSVSDLGSIRPETTCKGSFLGSYCSSFYKLLWLLSANGLCSLVWETVLPRLDANPSSTIGVMGAREVDDVSYDMMR